MPYTTLELIAGSLKNLFAIMSNIVDQGGASDLANGPVMGQDHLRDPIPPLLKRPLTQWNAQHRRTQGWHGTAARPNHSCYLPYEARQPLPIDTDLLCRNGRLAQRATG